MMRSITGAPPTPVTASPWSNTFELSTTDGTMQLDPDFNEFIASCTAHDVRYLIVGGYAVAAHGHPRYTKDLVVWILTSPDNANRLVDALDDFGFGSLGLTPDDFTEPDTVIQLGYPPKRIDIITSATGIDFAASYPQRTEIALGGLDHPVPFIGLSDLIANKAATARPQDLADIDALQQPENT